MSRKMKDSCVPWVGDIPEKWSAQSVKNLVEPGKNGIKIGPFGSALKGKTLDAGPVKIYNQANLISEDFDVSRHFVSEETFKELSAYQVFPGDILFSMMGTIGKCCQMPANKQVGIMDSHLLKARLNSKILPEFFIYAFDKDRNPSTFDQLMLLSKGSIMNGLNSEIVRKVKIAVPPINEQHAMQHAIVSYLDSHCATIDSAISKHQQIIEKLEEYRKAVITQAVTKGLNPNVEMKESSIPWVKSIPAEWSEQPLKILFNNRKNKNTDCAEVNLLSLSYGRIIRKDINSNEGLLPENFSGYNIIEPNDIVLRLTDLQNDHRSLRTGLVTEHGIITSAYVTLCPKTDINSEYYHYLLHSYDIQKVFYTLGEGIRQSLKYEDLSKVLVPVPSRKEQDDIVRYLNGLSETVDKAIDKHNQLISKLQEYKQSLIYNAVTGKIDCTTEA